MATIYKRDAKWQPIALKRAFTALDAAAGEYAEQFVAARKLADLIRFDTAESLADSGVTEGVVLFYLPARDVWRVIDPILVKKGSATTFNGSYTRATKRLLGALEEVFKRQERGW